MYQSVHLLGRSPFIGMYANGDYSMSALIYTTYNTDPHTYTTRI